MSLAEYILLGEGDFHFAGDAIKIVGDVDGDGREDVLVGAPNDGRTPFAAKVYLYLASTIMTSPSSILNLTDADYIFTAEAGLDVFGSSLDASDIDNDGRADLILGSSTAANA